MRSIKPHILICAIFPVHLCRCCSSSLHLPPLDLARFFRVGVDLGLDKAKVGEFLGEKDDFNLQVTNSLNPAPYFSKEPYIRPKEPSILSTELYFCSKEPYIRSKEPYIRSIEPYIVSKEPFIRSNEPYIRQRKPNPLPIEPHITSKEPFIRSKEPFILSKEP